MSALHSPLLQSSLGSCLLDIFSRNAERQVFIDVRNGDSRTYERLWRESLCVASFLQKQGVGVGDPVVLSMENCAELAVLYFACLHSGARAVPINPSYHPRDFGTIVASTKARIFFTTPSVHGRVSAALGDAAGLQVHCLRPSVERASDQDRALVNLSLPDIVDRFPRSERTLADSADDDIAFTMFTSGSTGLPKGINIRLGGILGNGRLFAARMGLGPDQRFYNMLSMTYLGGLYNLMLIPMLAEGSFVLDGVFGPSNLYGFWENVRLQQVNTLWFSPTMLSMLLMADDGDDLSFLKNQITLGLVGMAPLAVDLKRRFEARFGFRLFENYGLSETTFLCTDDPHLNAPPGSVGTCLDGVTVRVLDNDMKPVPSGREGQIGIKTPYLMAGYDQEVAAESLAARSGGYFLTGDVGYLDGDGNLFITGRQKDLIIRGGINISPKAIEDVVYRLDSVEEAAVVGVPHPMYGEEVALVLKVREKVQRPLSIHDVEKFCENNIAHFMRPKIIYFIDELPKGATGKIQKAVLKRLLADRVNPLGG